MGESAAVGRAVRRVLGGRRLRTEQGEVLGAVEGGDTLAVLASGAGKTAVYAIAGLVRGGRTVVVSPTVSLQRDQVAALGGSGLAAAEVNSLVPAGERRERLAAFGAGRLEFLLLAPEQLERADVVAAVRDARPGLLVVDEAHCVSAWGHDFRPDYLRIRPAAREWGRPTVLALTATAGPSLRREIADWLGMTDPAVVVRGLDRSNLWLGVRQHEDAAATRAALVAEVLASEPPGLVYVATRRDAEDLAAELTGAGRRAVAYHGTLRRAAREAAHQGFRAGEVPLVVATSAFGMGIDKPDVRFVYHLQPPESVDAYWQEAGRAGRDGEPARTILFHQPHDLALRRFFASGAGPDAEQLEAVLDALAGGPVRRRELADRLGLRPRRLTRALNMLEAVGAVRVEPRGRVRALPSDGEAGEAGEAAKAAVDRAERHRTHQETQVEMMRWYAETTDCRRRVVLELLGERWPDPCGHCDNCAAGTSRHAADRPFPVGAAVEHASFGRGTVRGGDQDTLVVEFDGSGYRTLAVSVVTGNDLMTIASGND